MLDRKTTAVMQYINTITDDGGYKVIETEEVLRLLPPKAKIDRDTFHQIVNYLKEREFISVKYSADGEYCLTSLPKGRSFVESKEEQVRENRKKERVQAFIPFLAGMLGAFLGSGLFFALYLLFTR